MRNMSGERYLEVVPVKAVLILVYVTPVEDGLSVFAPWLLYEQSLCTTAHWGPDLLTDCWSHAQRWSIIQPVYGLRVVRMSSSPAVIDFLDRDYCHKSIATHIIHDAELTPIPHTLIKNSFPSGNQASAVSRNMSSKQYALNRVVMGQGVFLHLITS